MATILKQIGKSIYCFSIVYAMPVVDYQRKGLFVGMQAIDQRVKDILLRILQTPFEFLL